MMVMIKIVLKSGKEVELTKDEYDEMRDLFANDKTYIRDIISYPWGGYPWQAYPPQVVYYGNGTYSTDSTISTI